MGGELTVAVKVSALQLVNLGYTTRVKQVLIETGLVPNQLEIEVDEEVTVDERPIILETLHELRKLGISITLDGFGGGAGALARLRDFPFNRVKISRELLIGVPAHQDSTWVLSGLMMLAKGLGWQVTAQGVSDDVQVEFLMQQGCQRLQGELFGGPVSVGELSTPLVVVKPLQQAG